MKIHNTLSSVIFIYCIAAVISAFGGNRPNFVMIVSESHSISAFGSYKGYLSKIDPTPNLDRISQKSVVFAKAFCTNATAGPSNAVILTGKHSHINGVTQNGNVFDDTQEHLPKNLQVAGYETALIGRWNLGKNPKYFNYWNILVDSTQKYNPVFTSSGKQKQIEGHSTDIITDLAIQWLGKRNKEKPFFLIIQFNATTAPWLPAIRHLNLYDDKLLPEPKNLIDTHMGKSSPSRYQSMSISKDLDFSDDLFFPDQQIDKNQSAQPPLLNSKKNILAMTPEQLSAWTLSWRPKNEAFLRENQSQENILQWKFQRFVKNYLRCVRGIDDNLKRIETALSETNSKDTFFIYTSNHGRLLGEHGWYGSRWMYEESMQIPLIINPDLSQNSPKLISSLVQNLDIAPTIMEYAQSNNFSQNQGLSLKPLIEAIDNNETWRDYLYYHYNEFPSNQMIAKHYGIRTPKYKIIHFYQFNEWEFYDLNKDPFEEKNQFKNPVFSSQIEEMKQLLFKIREKYLDETDISIMPEEWRKIHRGPEARKE